MCEGKGNVATCSSMPQTVEEKGAKKRRESMQTRNRRKLVDFS